jgi:hypothetical protein
MRLNISILWFSLAFDDKMVTGKTTTHNHFLCNAGQVHRTNFGHIQNATVFGMGTHWVLSDCCQRTYRKQYCKWSEWALWSDWYPPICRNVWWKPPFKSSEGNHISSYSLPSYSCMCLTKKQFIFCMTSVGNYIPFYHPQKATIFVF